MLMFWLYKGLGFTKNIKYNKSVKIYCGMEIMQLVCIRSDSKINLILGNFLFLVVALLHSKYV